MECFLQFFFLIRLMLIYFWGAQISSSFFSWNAMVSTRISPSARNQSDQSQNTPKSSGQCGGGTIVSCQCRAEHEGTRCQVRCQEVDRRILLPSWIQTESDKPQMVRRMWSTAVHKGILFKWNRQSDPSSRVCQLIWGRCQAFDLDQSSLRGGNTMDIHQHENPQCSGEDFEAYQRVWSAVDIFEVISQNVELWFSHRTGMEWPRKRSILKIDKGIKITHLIWGGYFWLRWLCTCYEGPREKTT